MRIAAFMTLTVTRHSVTQVRLYQYGIHRNVLTGTISLERSHRNDLDSNEVDRSVQFGNQSVQQQVCTNLAVVMQALGTKTNSIIKHRSASLFDHDASFNRTACKT